MKKTALILAYVLLTVSAGVFGGTISEDFSSDPNWSVMGMDGANPSDFGYNSTQHMVAAVGTSTDPGTFIRRSTWDVYYRGLPGVISDATSFTMEADIQVYSDMGSNGAGSCVGLFNSGSAYAEAGNTVIFKSLYYNTYSLYFSVYLDGGAQLTVQKIATADTWYSAKVDYNADTRTFTYYVDDVQVGSTLVLDASQHFTTNIFGVSNLNISSGSTSYLGRADNMSLTSEAIPEPATIGLLAVGCVLGLMKSRKRA